jgi:hypothetical protein
MVSTVTALNGQIKSLAPELNSASIPGVVSVTSSNPSAPIDFAVKVYHSEVYIFAAISRPGTADGTFTIAGLSGSGSADVLDENRSANVSDGRFSDSFASNAVHLYKIELNENACEKK